MSDTPAFHRQQLISAQRAAILDQQAIRDLGIPAHLLMENAGANAARIILRRYPMAQHILIVCGPGRNGGDGCVVARHLVGTGKRVALLMVVDETKIVGDARMMFRIAEQCGVVVHWSKPDGGGTSALLDFTDFELIVDAVFGTGLSRVVDGLFAEWIVRLEQSGLPIVSLDVPSGIDASSGECLGRAIHANLTITFQTMKRGLWIEPGASHAGTIEIAPLGIPEVGSGDHDGLLLTREWVRDEIGRRAANTHKGQYGHVVVIAGSRGKSGAALLTARGALRSGAGLVTLVVPQSIGGQFLYEQPELMVEPVPDRDGHFSTCSLAAIQRHIEGKDSVVIGPGIGREDDIISELTACQIPIPMLIDADGLWFLNINRPLYGRILITPHPGEAGRLLGETAAAVQARRLSSAQRLQQALQCELLLKGSKTLILSADGKLYVNPTGNPGMSSAGMGDVLSGMVSAFLARGLDPSIGLATGAFLHGLAGDLAAARVGEESLVATDLIESLPDAFASISL